WDASGDFGNDYCGNSQRASVGPGPGLDELNNRSSAQQESCRREERREGQAPQAPSQKISGATGVSPSRRKDLRCCNLPQAQSCGLYWVPAPGFDAVETPSLRRRSRACTASFVLG